MASLKKHRRQWFISMDQTPGVLDRLPDFRTRKLADRLYLHHDSDLRLSSHDWPDGTQSLVLGTIIDEPSGPDSLHCNMGRFVAITSNWLSLDATGSMGVFYFIDPQDIVCSSSAALTAEISGLPLVGRELQSSKMNWDPVPLARIAGMKKLFVDQRLNIVEGTTAVALRSVSEAATTDAASARLADELTATAKALEKTRRPLYLGLTGGSDSRAVFCSLVNSNVEFEAYTLVLGDKRSRIDAKVAASLCKRYGIRHTSIRGQGQNDADLEIYRMHSGGCEGDRGKVYAVGNFYRHLPDHAIALHGGCFEVGQRFYERRFESVRFESAESAIGDLGSCFADLGEVELASLQEWYLYRRANPIQGVDFIDAFYIDQRRGGWGAANRQEEDVFGFEWLIFANSWRFVDILLSASLEDRRNNSIQKRAMEILLPGIVGFEPINPRPSLVGKILSRKWRKKRH